MPAIRLADIPNAGPQAAAASAAMIGAPSVPRYQVNPEVAQLGGAAMMDSRSTRNAAQSMLTQTLELDAFSQEARAMGKFADSIGGLGDVAMKWGQKFAEAKDYADINRAETLLAIASQNQKADQATLPMEKWGESLARNQEQAKRALAEIKFSNNAAEKFKPYLDSWTLKSEVAMKAESRIKQLELDKTDVKANALRLSAEGNFEAALVAFKGGVDRGLFAQEEFDKFGADMRDNEIRATEAMQTDRITADLMTDYTVAKQNLNEYVKSAGDAKDDARIKGAYGEMPMSKVRRLMAQVDQQGRITEANNYNILAQAIDSNTPIRDANGNEILITDKDKLESALASYKVTGTESKKRLERLISDNVPYDAKKISEVNARLATYDPSIDNNLGEFATLQNEIAANVPKQLRPFLNDRLAQAVKKFNADGTLKSPSEKWQGDIINNVLNLGKSGLLGDPGTEKTSSGMYGEKITDPAKNNAYWSDVLSIQNGLRDWFANPANKDKTPADALEYRDSLIKPKLNDSAKKLWESQKSKPSFWSGESYSESISSGQFGVEDKANLSGDFVDWVKNMEARPTEKQTGKFTSYQDGKQISVGYGTRSSKLGEQISESEADRRLRKELATHAKNIDSAASEKGYKLTKGQRYALISFDFNTGDGAKLIKTSQSLEEIKTRMPSWNKITKDGVKVESKGLNNRRNQELQKWNS
jgi:GH24 family phage-related lysozyme (muramidase)